MPTKSQAYDAVVIGSGFGGCLTACRLARAGARTALLERGGYANRDALDWDQAEILIRQRYRSASPVMVRQYADRAHGAVYPNEVVGGLSVFYGGASLRMRESDFTQWPLDYGAMEPFYTEAERLLGVHGEAGTDPFESTRSAPFPKPAVEMAPPAVRIRDAARALGYRPFPIPLAINFSDPDRPVCVRCITCDGFPCKIEAKNDLVASVLALAGDDPLTVMPGVVARAVRRAGDGIVAVGCVDTRSGTDFQLAADLFVVSGGAIGSAALLLRSGLGETDGSGTLGRHLMRHCNGVVAGIFPFRTNPDRVFHKQVCLTDFYEDLRAELGTSVGVIQDIFTPAPQVLRHFAPAGLKRVAGFSSACMQNLLCIAEDDPRPENAVALSDETDIHGLPMARVTHAYSQADYRRRDHLVHRARRILKQAGAMVTRMHAIDTFSHAVGTARFGRDPKTSALDPNCRMWGIDNLYVVDGSFMPTSGGVNPSLTIAANALRVAQHLVASGR